jgi:hypothetical protein
MMKTKKKKQNLISWCLQSSKCLQSFLITSGPLEIWCLVMLVVPDES